MLNIGPQELIIILVIALIVVGPQRLPELGRSIGRGLRELRKAQDEVKRTIRVNLDDEPPNGSSGANPPGSGAAAGPADGHAVEARAAGGTLAGLPEPVAGPDATPTASQPVPADEIREISRSLGRSLAELRRAKEEVQRSFRVDLASATRPPDRKRTRAAASEPPSRPAEGEEPSATAAGTRAASTAEGSPDASTTPDPSTE
jgi:TatA/E family protein of Tat protein translocase